MRKIKSGRFSTLYLPFGLFIFFSTAIRTMLLCMALPNLNLSLFLLARIYGVGFFFDCVTFSYLIIPFVLYLVFAPDAVFNNKYLKPVIYVGYFVAIYVLLFDIPAEYFFFDEFGTRFNFIAVDYLIYTTEVTRNIRESYPVGWIFATIFAVDILIFLFIKRHIDHSFNFVTTFRKRLKAGAVFMVLPALSFAFIDLSITDISRNNYANELAGDGIYGLAAAFMNNELDYDKFYAGKDTGLVLKRLRDLLREKNSRFVSDDPHDITREIKNTGPESRLNVIVVVEESLSAEYLGAFGNGQGLTPNLDRLAGGSLLFTHMYATGTRTVRGLEAITLSVPPLPGESIIKRPENENLFSWGSLMRSRGYDTKFIYAGYGYFDNMNRFFSGNGFSIVDRHDFSDKEVTFSNAWGVCDEDLFNKVVGESDKSFEAGKPFFSMVMTTSNHRPFTYPEGKIDIPSKEGREGGVKYADYAIGRLLDKAASRPWFRDTVFVIVADHCAGSARKVALPVKKYEIPLIIYSPAHLKPERVDKMASQIDVAPTVLGMLNFSYRSRFFGKDLMKMDPSTQRGFISTYEKLGFIENDKLVILEPKKKVEFFAFARSDGSAAPLRPQDGCMDDALGYYQGMNYIYKHGMNRDVIK